MAAHVRELAGHDRELAGHDRELAAHDRELAGHDRELARHVGVVAAGAAQGHRDVPTQLRTEIRRAACAYSKGGDEMLVCLAET